MWIKYTGRLRYQTNLFCIIQDNNQWGANYNVCKSPIQHRSEITELALSIKKWTKHPKWTWSIDISRGSEILKESRYCPINHNHLFWTIMLLHQPCHLGFICKSNFYYNSWMLKQETQIYRFYLAYYSR